LKDAIEAIKPAIENLQNVMHKTQEAEHKIIDTKGGAAEVFSKIYDMETFMEGNEIMLDRNACLRHILQLVHVRIPIVDNDVEVTEFKRRINEVFLKYYSEEGLLTLESNKGYIELSDV
jgi:hypothetical protein